MYNDRVIDRRRDADCDVPFDVVHTMRRIEQFEVRSLTQVTGVSARTKIIFLVISVPEFVSHGRQ